MPFQHPQMPSHGESFTGSNDSGPLLESPSLSHATPPLPHSTGISRFPLSSDGYQRETSFPGYPGTESYQGAEQQLQQEYLEDVNATNEDLMYGRVSALAAKSVQHWEKRNDRQGRAVFVTQKELRVVGGNKVQTRIEVVDTTFEDCPVVFSVKHTHGNLWGRQTVVHKNLLLACHLAEVSHPPLEVPADAHRLFAQPENMQHLHSYMERVLPHIRFPQPVPKGVRIYWFRAAENGATILQNTHTGRLIVIKSKEKRLPAAANTVLRALSVVRALTEICRGSRGTSSVRSSTPLRQAGGGGAAIQISAVGQQFMSRDAKYPSELSKGDLSNLGNADEVLSPEERQELIDNWAVGDSVSPWSTRLIVKTQGLRKSQIVNMRYSIGLDAQDPMSLSLQVHSNEPLSRELQAFPVCMIPMPLSSCTKGDLLLTYKQSLWFLTKLYELHLESENSAAQPPRGGRAGGVTPRRDSRYLTPSRRGDSHVSPSTRSSGLYASRPDAPPPTTPAKRLPANFPPHYPQTPSSARSISAPRTTPNRGPTPQRKVSRRGTVKDMGVGTQQQHALDRAYRPLPRR